MKERGLLTRRMQALSYFFIGYVLLAFMWWTYLLYLKNEDAYHSKKEIIELKSRITNVDPKPIVNALTNEYVTQRYMIIGESFILVSMLFGFVALFNKAYYRGIASANKERNFLLSVTHELKTPLASIRLALETFFKRDLKHEQIRRLSALNIQEVDRLDHLVSNILLTARMDNNFVVDKRAESIQEIVNYCVELVERKQPDRLIELQQCEDCRVMVDKNAMIQVVQNLLSNAVKYSPEASPIIIKVATVGGEVQIDVVDEGFGIPNKEKLKVLSKFYRIGNEDTRETQGTGLGLYIVRKIVQAHGGELLILDNEPKGTIMRVLLKSM